LPNRGLDRFDGHIASLIRRGSECKSYSGRLGP
jgi:hypothetical protein